jgi:hypothetical protein
VLELLSEPAPATRIIKSPKREYTLGVRLGVGDIADVYAAVGDSKEYVVKVSRIVGGDRMLETEQKTLAAIISQAVSSHYDRYFPTPCESFPVNDTMQKRVNVFLHEPGFYTLEQVHAQHPELDGRHLGWIFKRLLTALGFAHLCGFVHGAICPSHVLIKGDRGMSEEDRGGHGLQLIGWGQSVKKGANITRGSAKYLSWYPHEVKNKQPALASTDIYMAARCILYLASGDAENRNPRSVPAEIQRFLRSCLLEGSTMRPDDAWNLLKEFDEVLRGIYGPPTYHNLVMV